MKLKHNKRRNTAFLFEVLIREATKNTFNKDFTKQKQVISLLEESFNKKTLLFKEYSLYKVLLEATAVEPRVADKLIAEAKRAYAELDKKELFQEQSALISKINKELSRDVYLNFVPNYRYLATIHQIFNNASPIKSKVLLEEKLQQFMSSSIREQKEKELQTINNLTLNTFINSFNKKYHHLQEEQKQLLNVYISSFANNGVELKLFLNEEVERLTEIISESESLEEVIQDSSLKEKLSSVKKVLREVAQSPIEEHSVKQVMRIQNLVKELKA